MEQNGIHESEKRNYSFDNVELLDMYSKSNSLQGKIGDNYGQLHDGSQYSPSPSQIGRLSPKAINLLGKLALNLRDVHNEEAISNENAKHSWIPRRIP